jgi:hypothetical protein
LPVDAAELEPKRAIIITKQKPQRIIFMVC